MADSNILSDFGINILEEEIDDVIFQTNEFLTDATFTGSQGPFWWLLVVSAFLPFLLLSTLCKPALYRISFRETNPKRDKNGTEPQENKIKNALLRISSLNICCTGTKVQICPVKNKSKHLNITGSVRFLFSCIKADNTNGIFSQMRRITGNLCVKIYFTPFGRIPGEDVATLRLFCRMIVQKSKPPPANRQYFSDKAHRKRCLAFCRIFFCTKGMNKPQFYILNSCKSIIYKE